MSSSASVGRRVAADVLRVVIGFIAAGANHRATTISIVRRLSKSNTFQTVGLQSQNLNTSRFLVRVGYSSQEQHEDSSVLVNSVAAPQWGSTLTLAEDRGEDNMTTSRIDAVAIAL